jgi:hypothetical protein
MYQPNQILHLLTTHLVLQLLYRQSQDGKQFQQRNKEHERKLKSYSDHHDKKGQFLFPQFRGLGIFLANFESNLPPKLPLESLYKSTNDKRYNNNKLLQ